VIKTIVLGVSGCIAAFKACEIISLLRKLNYRVKVIMTESAQEFITPLTLETLSANRVVTNMFDKDRGHDVEHISYAKEATAFLIAPATANVIAKLSGGIADDMLTSTILATHAPVIICPAMNTAMYENETTKKNIQILKNKGYIFIDPAEGMLACGDEGKGRLAEPKDIVNFLDNLLTPIQDLRGKTVLITAGATIEPIDAVRYLTNRSSGKMGFALAEAVMERGGSVILVKGNTTATVPKGAEIVNVETTLDMYDAVLKNLPRADIIIKAGAPCDYTVNNKAENKIKSRKVTLELSKTKDIASAVGEIKGNKKLIIFSAETENLILNAQTKLALKNADIVVANDVTLEGAGFNTDTNIASIICASGAITQTDLISKYELAHLILDFAND